MKRSVCIFAFLLVLGFSFHTHAITQYYHKVVANDVEELNKLGTALHISGLSGWPVSNQEIDGPDEKIDGVDFYTIDTEVIQIDANNQKIIYHLAVKNIKINGRGLTGTLPSLSFALLEGFNLNDNKITGSIPTFNFPVCTGLSLNRNQLTGKIPVFDMPELLTLDLQINQLTGPLPSSFPPKLVNLLLTDNQLDGELPALSLQHLQYFMASRNKFSGSIPNFDFPMLSTFELEENNLTGTIPNFNFPIAWHIRLTANQLTGNIPDFKLPELSNLALGDNNLTGEIPTFNMPKLILLNVKNNQLEGTFNSSGLPKLYSLYLQNNNISGIPGLKINSPDLTYVDISGNKLTFEDLEPNMGIGRISYTYNNQQRVPCYALVQGTNTKVSVQVGGTVNSYQWYKTIDGKSAKIEGATQEELVTPSEAGASYHCKITNSLVPGISIYSELSKLLACTEVAGFNFCIENGQWNGTEGTTRITNTNTVIINDYLVFSGTMTIDTLNFSIAANGQFYINNIPIPGGSTGKFVLAEGEFRLSLSEEDEKIRNFLNNLASYPAQLFGVSLNIEELQFFTRHDTVGIKTACSVHIPWASTGCGVYGIYEPGANLKLKSLEITNKGIFNLAFETENIGLFKKDYCIKNITLEYDWVKDVLIAGGQISLPFLAEIGGGLRMEKGFIDSVAWSVEGGADALLHTIPVGFGTLGVKGCYGHIAGLYNPNILKPLDLDVHLGGIFSDIKTDDAYKITGDARINWPKIFEINGVFQGLKPLEDLPFQLQGDGRVTYQVSDNLLEIAYSGKFLTADEQTWLASGGGSLTINLDKENPGSSGTFSGEITLPKIGDFWPFSWFNTLTFGTYMATFNNDKHLVHGVLYHHPGAGNTAEGDMLFKVYYIVNTQKQFYEQGYLTFPETSQVNIAVETKSATVNNTLTDTISVPGNCTFGVIEIKGIDKIPASTITSPNGKVFSATSIADSVLYTQSANNKSAFWSILSPLAGYWLITLEDAAPNDSVISHFQHKTPQFAFSAQQTGNLVNLQWNPAQLASEQVVNFFFDTDNVGFNGIMVGAYAAAQGSANIVLSEKYPGCSYYVYAQAITPSGAVETYAGYPIENPQPALAPPGNIVSAFNTQTGNIDISWTPVLSAVADGYIVTLADPEGNDSVLVMPDPNATGISLYIEDYQRKHAIIETYNSFGKTGCGYILPSLITGLNNAGLPNTERETIIVYPNPASAKTTVRFTSRNSSDYTINLVDFNGKPVTAAVSGHTLAGTCEREFDLAHLPAGIYFFVVRYNNQQLVAKCILSK